MASKIEMKEEQKKLYNELKRLSKRANQRIVILEREYGANQLAIKNLKSKLSIEPLQAWTSKGRVKVNKSMTIEELEGTIKATKQFLSSNLSTRRGLKKVRQKSIETLRRQFSTEAKELSIPESIALMQFFEDREVNKITNFIEGSNVLDIIEDVREQKGSFDDFVEKIEGNKTYNTNKNININLLRKIYIKYIFKGNTENEIEILYSSIFELINNMNTENDKEEIRNLIENLRNEGKIKESEYNYLINELNQKELY